MNIIMTGATGYIGKKLLKKLKIAGHRVYAVVRESSDIKGISDDIEEVIYGTPYLELYEKIRQMQPHLFISIAGYYRGQHIPEDIAKFYESNVLLPTYLTDAVVRANCRYIVHTASTQQNYGGSAFDPVNLYAASKQAFENVLQYYASVNGVTVMVLQIFDTYGADDVRNKIFNRVRQLPEGGTLEMSPGEQKLYLCYIDDVVNAVRGEEAVRLKVFIEKYIQYTNRDLHLLWGKREYMAKEIMDPTGYGVVLPEWSPKISYEEGIELCGNYDLQRSRKIAKILL